MMMVLCDSVANHNATTRSDANKSPRRCHQAPCALSNAVMQSMCSGLQVLKFLERKHAVQKAQR